MSLFEALLGGRGAGGPLTPADRARLVRIEQKLDVILKHLGIEYTEPAGSGVSPEVRQLALSGRKIEAIKLHREQTGLGLAEAKNAVESVQSAGG